MTRKVIPVCPECGEAGLEEYGTLDYTQWIESFQVNEVGAIVDTEWGDRETGYDEVRQGYQCHYCEYRGPRKAFVPKPGVVTVGKRGDDPAQHEEE